LLTKEKAEISVASVRAKNKIASEAEKRNMVVAPAVVKGLFDATASSNAAKTALTASAAHPSYSNRSDGAVVLELELLVEHEVSNGAVLND
jgi:hypothetical protein